MTKGGKKRTGTRAQAREAQQRELCERLALGESMRAICDDDHMPGRRTVFEWLAADEGFRRLYAAARVIQAETLIDEIMDIADDASSDWIERQDGEEIERVVDHEHIQRSRLRVDARKWLASKLAPKRYGDVTALRMGEADFSRQQLSDADVIVRTVTLLSIAGKRTK